MLDSLRIHLDLNLIIILRLVKQVIEASHKECKWTGMCGEMAGDATAVPLLFKIRVLTYGQLLMYIGLSHLYQY
jgi:signal transduction protein with GAF and PtsI domain